MPIRRRLAKRRYQYPEAIEALLRDEPLEQSEANRQALIECGYFHDYPELGPETAECALRRLRAWRGE